MRVPAHYGIYRNPKFKNFRVDAKVLFVLERK